MSSRDVVITKKMHPMWHCHIEVKQSLQVKQGCHVALELLEQSFTLHAASDTHFMQFVS